MERSARLIYLNKTCYNGLYRENKRGEFNVPFGRHKNPTLCDSENLYAVAAALQGTEIRCEAFDRVLGRARPADLIYFDPPYDPVSDTAYFVSYAKNGFNREDQAHLAEVFTQLSQSKAQTMLSNSNTAWIRRHYPSFTKYKVQARRSVNSRSDKRGPVAELVITNFTGAGDKS